VVHGFSIPAMEHSTVTAWGRGEPIIVSGEERSFRNMLRLHKERGFKMVACVSDSYDIFNAVENIWCGKLLNEVRESGMTVVIRPDSGDPVEVNREILRIMARKLGPEMKVNSKGYVVLPDYFRIIQGDGNNDEADIDRVLTGIEDAGFSASNIAFGMGGGLLQKLDRDTQRFAYKISAIQRQIFGADNWEPIRKVPKTDPTKASKGGRVDLMRIVERSGTARRRTYPPHLITVDRDRLEKTPTSGIFWDPETENYVIPEMEVVFKDGVTTSACDQTFSEIRKRASEQTLPEVA
jgi:nicotinamide phosphoribosyltransferase